MMYECWLAEIRGISDRKKRMLRKAFGTGKAVYDRTGACSASMDFFTKKDIEILRQAKQQKSVQAPRHIPAPSLPHRECIFWLPQWPLLSSQAAAGSPLRTRHRADPRFWRSFLGTLRSRAERGFKRRRSHLCRAGLRSGRLLSERACRAVCRYIAP